MRTTNSRRNDITMIYDSNQRLEERICVFIEKCDNEFRDLRDKKEIVQITMK